MLVKWLLCTLLIGFSYSATEDFDDVDFDFDFEDDYLKAGEVVEEDPTGLPKWLVKVKSVLNKEIDPSLCSTRKVHDRYKNHGYFFSWEEPKIRDLELNWAEAREFCRRRCMDVVSIETKGENEFIKKRLIEGRQKYAWTSGRKCNFIGCDRPDLVPHDIYGWFWSGSLERMPPTTNRLDNDWSETGGLGKPQPDNRESKQGGAEEECLAVQNNLFNDGVKWHDVACHHKKPFVCEDSERLWEDIDYESNEGDGSESEKEPPRPVNVADPNADVISDLTPVVIHEPLMQGSSKPSYLDQVPLPS